MSETADIILTHGGECLYFFEHLRHHHGGYKTDKDQGLCSEEMTTMAQIWGKQRFQGRFWKILKMAFVSLADGLTDRSKEKCLHSPLG